MSDLDELIAKAIVARTKATEAADLATQAGQAAVSSALASNEVIRLAEAHECADVPPGGLPVYGFVDWQDFPLASREEQVAPLDELSVSCWAYATQRYPENRSMGIAQIGEVVAIWLGEQRIHASVGPIYMSARCEYPMEGKPVHVVVNVSQSGQAELWLDGFRMSLKTAGAFPEVTGPLYIGDTPIHSEKSDVMKRRTVMPGAATTFTGVIGGFALMSVPQTPEQITTSFEAGPPPGELPPIEEPVTPPIEPPIDPPAGGGREVRVSSAGDLLAAWADLRPRDHIICAAGNYGGVQLQQPPKNGVRLEADGAVVFDAAFGRDRFMSGIADDVSIVGEFEFRRYGPQHPSKNTHGRLTEETAVIVGDRSWPHYSKRWVVRDVSFIDCPGREGLRLKGDNHEVHNTTFRNLASVGLVFNNAVDPRVSDCSFADINLIGAASHHHTGGIKALGGRMDDIPEELKNSAGGGWPASKGGIISRCTGSNLVNCRGLAWLDWDHDDWLIEDCQVDGVDYEGLAFEASARIKVVRFVARNTNRRHGQASIWSSMIMFQNSKECEVRNSTFYSGNEQAVIGVQNYNRENYGAYIGEFLGQYNHVYDCNVVNKRAASWAFGNSGPVRPDNQKPHPAAVKMPFCNWSGPGFPSDT